MFIQSSIILGSLILGGVEAAALNPSVSTGVLGARAATDASCRAYPGTSTWPTTAQWAALDAAVSGKLDAVVPPGAVCHSSFSGVPTFNQAKCTQLIIDYPVNQKIVYADPVLIMYDFWTNRTCIPTTDTSSACTIGSFPAYVIKATTEKDIQAGVNFARDNNVRLVIKNTGHDFMGKSIGAGSLSIWTHQLKSIKIIDKYSDKSTSYTGSAVTFGSGWQTADIYNTLDAIGKVIVGGECAGVGFSGGYIQGGGHSPLSTLHGMGADNVLQFTLITADGKSVTADALNNADLFWALRGGGGSTWGVVTSVTVKTYDTPKVAGAVITFQPTTTDLFWKGVDAFHSLSPGYVEAGLYAYYEITASSFLAKPLIGIGKNAAEMKVILAPLFAKLNAIGIPYTSVITEYPTFLAGYNALFDGEGAVSTLYTSSRLIQKKHVVANPTGVTQAFRTVAEDGLIIIGHIVAPGQFGGVLAETSVNPIWKDALLLPLYNVYWSGTETESQKWDVILRMRNVIDKAFKDVSPGSGTYINEANVYEPNWQNDFYGTSYPRLLSIKKQVDPNGVFYAKTAVGSESWAEVNGRLCRT